MPGALQHTRAGVGMVPREPLSRTSSEHALPGPRADGRVAVPTQAEGSVSCQLGRQSPQRTCHGLPLCRPPAPSSE